MVQFTHMSNRWGTPSGATLAHVDKEAANDKCDPEVAWMAS